MEEPKDVIASDVGCEAYKQILKEIEGVPNDFAKECSKAPKDEFNVIDLMKTNVGKTKEHYKAKYNPEAFWKQFGHVYPRGFHQTTEGNKAGSSVLDMNVGVILARLNVIEPKKVLEVGCGFGRILPFIAILIKSCEKIVGIDFSPTMVGQSAHYFSKLEPDAAKKIRVMQADARDIPFGDKEFDVVYTHVCLTHIPPKFIPKVTSEISRVAKNWIIHVERFSHPYEHPNPHRWSHMLPPYYLDLGWELHEMDIAREEHQTKVLVLRR